jgi:hypothetical protein
MELQLVEGKAPLHEEVDQVWDEDVGHAVALGDAANNFAILHEVVDVDSRLVPGFEAPTIPHMPRVRSASTAVRTTSGWPVESSAKSPL